MARAGLADCIKALNELSSVKSGDSLFAVLSADAIRAIADSILALARGDNITGAGSVFKTSTANNVVLFGRRSDGDGTGSESSASHPYKVTALPPDPATEEHPDPPPKISVEIDSWLTKGLKADDKVTVTGLGPDGAVEFSPGGSGYFYIWLHADITDGEIMSVYIDTGDDADLWAVYPDPIDLDSSTPPVQAEAYQLIAYIKEADAAYPDRVKFDYSDTSYEIVQCVHTNQILCEGCFEGRTVLVFKPGNAPGPS